MRGWEGKGAGSDPCQHILVDLTIEVASVIELSETSGQVAAGLFMTEG